MAKKEKTSESRIKNFLRKCRRKPDGVVSILRFHGVIGHMGALKQGLTLEGLEEEIKRAFSGRKIKAVAIEINSPGGSPVQSHLIYQYVREMSKEKKIPVYCFTEDVAASGGYYLACAGEKIYASESSIIGSIGVISAGFGYVEAIKKLGVERRVYAQGENKSILDPFQPSKASDVKILNEVQKDVHEVFKSVVREARGKKIAKTDEKELFSGIFYGGKRAVEKGLADEIGDVYSVMRKKFGKDVKFNRISKSKGMLRRLFSNQHHHAVDQFVDRVVEMNWYQRFGL